MKKILIKQKDLKFSLFGADLLNDTNDSSLHYNNAQLIDNLNIPLSPLIDVKTSLYENRDTKAPVNVLYKIDTSVMPSSAIDNVIINVSTNSDNTVHVETVSLDNLYYRMFNINVLENTKGFRYGVSDSDIHTVNININDSSSGLFTYDFGNPSVYKKYNINPSDEYIWIAVDKNELLSSVDINSDGTLSIDSSYFIEACGFSGNDSPQAIELDTVTTSVTDNNNVTWVVFISDSKFGIDGLKYNIIVKPGLRFFQEYD